MSFKRTSEGRVFFQGTDEGANDAMVSGASKPLTRGAPSPAGAASGHMGDAQTQVQIIALLKALNERLKTTQSERNAMRRELDAYKDLLAELESKSERSEKAYVQIEQKLSRSAQASDKQAREMAEEALKEMAETRKLLLSLEGKSDKAGKDMAQLKSHVERHQQVGSQLMKKQAALENTQQLQARKVADHTGVASKIIQRIKDGEERYELLNDRVEQTGAEQARIARKLEKAMEERARFMRKIERIEETVLQTRDALNARAMVLLTDQDAAAGAAMPAPASTAQATEVSAEKEDKAQPLEMAGKHRRAVYPQAKKDVFGSFSKMQIVTAASFLLLCLSGGLFIALLQNPTLFSNMQPVYPQLSEGQQSITPRYMGPSSVSPAQGADATDGNSQILDEIKNIEAMEWKIRQDARDQNTADQTSAQDEDADIESADAILSSDQQAAQTSDATAYDNDIGALDLNDQEQVKAALEGNAQQVARALNAIEPGNTAQEETASLTMTDKVEDPTTLINPDPALSNAMQELETQAFSGIGEAQHDLAAIYTAGHGGVRQDFERARFWFEQAASRGVENAAYNLGVIYHQGLGVQADIQTALQWYESAAALGHPEAQYNLGIAYIEGIGVTYDPARAVGYFTNAAKSGIMEAAYNLGLIYENGLLGSARPDEALMWYKIAADQGSPEAQAALKQLANTLGIDEEEVNTLVEGMREEAVSATEGLPAGGTGSQLGTSAFQPRAQALTREDITAQVQNYLMDYGLYPGPADGITGPLTADAVRAYQRNNALPVTGEVSQRLLAHMTNSVE